MSEAIGRDRPSYNQAQIREKTLFLLLLARLCAGITAPLHTFGRPPIPLSDVLFATVFKVYTTKSCSWCIPDLEVAQKDKLISRTPRPSTILKYFEMKQLARFLRLLVIESSLPLRKVETIFAVDSTGFSTCRFARWVDRRYGRREVKEKRVWLKVHVM